MVKDKQVFINIVEIKNPDVVAQLVANNIAEQLENRASLEQFKNGLSKEQ